MYCERQGGSGQRRARQAAAARWSVPGMPGLGVAGERSALRHGSDLDVTDPHVQYSSAPRRG